MIEKKVGLRAWSAFVTLTAVTALGCGDNNLIAHDLPPYTGGQGGSGGAASSTGAGTAGGVSCSGKCLPLGPVDWLGPALLWMGPTESEAPECPPSAPVSSEFVFNELSAPNTCGTCKCEAPSGSCALPTTATAAAASCTGDGPSVPHTDFSAPADWDGSCTAENAIPANQKCNGVDCVQVLIIAPLTLTESVCAVSVEPVASKLPYLWGAVARTCRGSAVGSCASPADTCAPPAPPGFEQCLSQYGKRECPSAYPIKHLFYYGLEDTRDCTPCACSAPTGGACSTFISAYKDSACSTSVGATTLTSAQALCIDIKPQGSSLGSKSASAPVYNPGVCQVGGGEPVGQASPAEPATFCCLPSET